MEPSDLSSLVTGVGGYEGGGVLSDLKSFFTYEWSPPVWFWAIIIAVLMVLIVVVATGPTVSGFSSTLRHLGAPSHGAYGLNDYELNSTSKAEGFDGMRRDQHAASLMSEGFYGDRTAPHFANATNRVLNKEDRERGAVRALGKINQERLRRATADEDSTTPLPWGPFWSEWKKTHPMDGEPGYEGFSAKKDLVPY